MRPAILINTRTGRNPNTAKAFEILPAKYRNDATCLKCHTTGTAGDVASYQYGVSCQACHGPGAEHADYALRFVNERITEEGLKTLREKIQRLDLHQCVDCHISKAHKKHPPYDGQAELATQPKAISQLLWKYPWRSAGRRGRQWASDQPTGWRSVSDMASSEEGQAIVGMAHLPSGRLIRLDCLRGL